jgi:catechol 2,3-dioxygenase-like lactoylglutathione lyase family enzyme
MAIAGMIHVNINCSDYDRSKAFYEVLGFKEALRVPETNPAKRAAAVGMTPSRVKGGLLELSGPEVKSRMIINLLEWIEPKDEAPPYDHLYHYGIARIALATTDLDADMARLKDAGAEFLSEPVSMPPESGMPSRFVCFKDPDGTVLELVEPGLGPNRS